jgi:hypothetical protein
MTVQGETRVLLDPFFVVAAQNPHQFHGTYPLPEGQLDRFMVATTRGYLEWRSELHGAPLRSSTEHLYGAPRYSRFSLNYCVAGLCSMPPLTPAHCRAGRPQSAMKPAAAPSSKVLFGS